MNTAVVWLSELFGVKAAKNHFEGISSQVDINTLPQVVS